MLGCMAEALARELEVGKRVISLVRGGGLDNSSYSHKKSSDQPRYGHHAQIRLGLATTAKMAL